MLNMCIYTQYKCKNKIKIKKNLQWGCATRRKFPKLNVSRVLDTAKTIKSAACYVAYK